jgi:ATP-binding cassette subfamily B protein
MSDLRAEIFGHLQRMGVRFYDRNAVGRLVTRITTDVDTLNEMFTSGVVAIAGDMLTLLFVVGVMFYLSPRLALVLFAIAPLVLAVSVWFRRRARESYREVRVAIAKINSFLQEHFSGIAVVQIFNHEGRSWEQFNELNAEHRDAQRQAIRAHAYFFPAVEWLGILGVAALLVYGGVLVLDKAITIGVVVAFLQYGTRVFRPLQDLSEKYNILQSAMASSERIFTLLDTPPAEELSDGQAAAGAVVPVAQSRVEFKNVWFAYQGEDWVLRDVSLTIEPGEMLAIVGHTGAGKTTLISLLLRFYDVRKGAILVGGRDVRDWPVNELRRQFGVVLQDPYLFSGTIESNIRLRNQAVSEERIREVIGEVNLGDFVAGLPHGLQQRVLERGGSLSSGQKQLLSFARALAFNPRFLILDEATSSVDTDTEFKIRDALSRMLTGHTSIVIAHRLSTIQRATRIAVMHKGEVREMGTHQELLTRRGIYFRLYQLQYQDQDRAMIGSTAEVDLPGADAAIPVAPAHEVTALSQPPQVNGADSPGSVDTSLEALTQEEAALSSDGQEEGRPASSQSETAVDPVSPSIRTAEKLKRRSRGRRLPKNVS